MIKCSKKLIVIYIIEKNIKEGTRNIDLQDIKFHQCVRLTKFENERVISFVPPDKKFELISYRIQTQIKSLFTLEVATNKK